MNLAALPDIQNRIRNKHPLAGTLGIWISDDLRVRKMISPTRTALDLLQQLLPSTHHSFVFNVRTDGGVSHLQLRPHLRDDGYDASKGLRIARVDLTANDIRQIQVDHGPCRDCLAD